jgi:hypothetical protein
MFLEWLIEWYSVRQLCNQYAKDENYILEYIRHELDNNKLDNVDEIFDNVNHIMIDGVWIRSDICLIIYYEYNLEKILRFWFYDGEKLQYIIDDLIYLKEKLGYNIKSFTVDWWLQIISAIKTIYKDSIIQRCLVHIHRQVRTYISKNPKQECWKELKSIVTFKQFESNILFETEFNKWLIKRDSYLKEKTYWKNRRRYTHKKIRQAKSHIKNALPYMFSYLDDDKIANNTNRLEWLNAIVVEKIYDHRWLRTDRLISLISLWLYYRNYK